MRMAILRESAEHHLLSPLRTHNWDAKIAQQEESGEYIVVEARRADHVRRVALMYSWATNNAVYKRLDKVVNHILINGNGALDHIENYAYGISVPVDTIGAFGALLLKWNMEVAPPQEAEQAPIFESVPEQPDRYILSETPIEQIWFRVDQLRSTTLALKMISKRGFREGCELSPEQLAAKAEGLSFAIRNAADYFRAGHDESLSRRALSLYYGSLSFAFAEMLAAPTGGAESLDAVEAITKQGHGLYTVEPEAASFGEQVTGVLDRGFFPQWAAFLGHDTSGYPQKKAKKASEITKLPAAMTVTVQNLLARIPELGDLYFDVFDAPPSWVTPLYDTDANLQPSIFGRVQTERPRSTYIRLIDSSGRLDMESVKFPWPFAEPTLAASGVEGVEIRARLDHATKEYWHESIPVHRSPFMASMSLILPLFGNVTEYRAIALVLLYSLSIFVRYRPSVWRRVQEGDWDEYRALIASTLDIFERVLPQQFLAAILGERVHARQPGQFF